MAIPRDKIDEILTSANVVEVIGDYVRLKKRGRSFLGLCPFHTEKTPSFSVSAEKGLFKCFGCGRGGNVFGFLMEYEKISFIDAVKKLAEKYGITLPEERQRSGKPDQEREDLYAVSAFASRLFQDVLRSGKESEALTYLKRRNWNQETLTTFQIGIAPDSWDELLTKATAQGLVMETLVTAGLVVKRDDGKLYDRFRRRLIFPIHSYFGKIVGFGARAIRPGDEPKYLNSPETPIYSKSQILYGLYQAIAAIRDLEYVIIVEGYADVLSVHQSGLKNVVATSGTALTPEQIKLLARYTRNFIFLYDADSAGAHAMVRGVDIIIEQGYDVKIVQLPSGEDPDSFVQAKGKEALEQYIRSAISFVDFILLQHQSEGKFEAPDQKASAIRSVLQVLVKMDDELRRDFYIKHIAEKYDVYETVLHRELEKLRTELQKNIPRAEPKSIDRDVHTEDTIAFPAQTLPPSERDFLSNIFQAPEFVINIVLNSVHIEDFQDERVRQIVHALMEQKEVFGEINLPQLEVELVETELQRMVADLSITKYHVSERWNELQIVRPPNYMQLLFDNYKGIAKAFIDKRIAEKQKQMRSRIQSGIDESPLMAQYQQYMRFRQAILHAHLFEDMESIRRELMQHEEFGEMRAG